MAEDAAGHIYPQIDGEKCVSCGLCEQVCDMKQTHSSTCNIQAAYAITVKDKDILYKSTSGGAFTALSDVILARKGGVAGAVLGDDFIVRHELVYDAHGRDSMRGSKYVQSDTSQVYRKIQEALNSGEYVLFVGCPCQAAGLRAYLRKEYSKLYVVDLLCHGVPSNRFFKDHIAFLEKKTGKKITDYFWRSKRYGWFPNFVAGFQDSHGRQIYNGPAQAYSSFFWSNLSLRPSCLNCPYRGLHRQGDITIADFWGIERLGQANAYTGVSLAFVNSDKGAELLEKLDTERVRVQEVPVEDVKYRISDVQPTCPADPDEFWNCYQAHGYEQLVQKYAGSKGGDRIKFRIKKIYRRMLTAFKW